LDGASGEPKGQLAFEHSMFHADEYKPLAQSRAQSRHGRHIAWNHQIHASSRDILELKDVVPTLVPFLANDLCVKKDVLASMLVSFRRKVGHSFECLLKDVLK
jgi:hypothetical protein